MSKEIKFISQDLSDAAKTALRMEDEGYAIYVEAAKKTKNPLGRSTLNAIAGKELIHKQAIEDFYKRITGSDVEVIKLNFDSLWSARLKTEILNGIKDSLKNITGTESDLLKAYEVSMEMEKKGFKFYQKIVNETDDPEAKKLFSFLEKEENTHYDLLQDTFLYLNNPSEWFHKEEKWLVEG